MIYCIDISDENEPPEFIATTKPGGYEVIQTVDSWQELKELYMDRHVDSLLDHDVTECVRSFRELTLKGVNNKALECFVDDWFKMVFKDANKGESV